MAIQALSNLWNNIRQGMAAIGAGQFASASAALSQAFGSIFHLVGAGLFAFSFINVLRNKELEWYEKLLPATMFGLSSALSIATAVTMALALASVVPILAFVGSAFTLVRNVTVLIAEYWESRRIKKDLTNEVKLRNMVDRLGVPKDLIPKLETMQQAQQVLKSFRQLPDKLFESDPQTVREICSLHRLGDKLTEQFVEASQIQKDLSTYQLPFAIREKLIDLVLYDKSKSHLKKKEMRDVMVRILNHNINVNAHQQEKIHHLLKLVPIASDQKMGRVLDDLCLPAHLLTEYKEFQNNAELQNTIEQFLASKNLSPDWLRKSHPNITESLQAKGFSAQEINVLKRAHELHRSVKQYKLPNDLKVDLKRYIRGVGVKQKDQAQLQFESDFLVKMADYFCDANHADKSSPLFTLIFETPDFKYKNMEQWLAKAVHWHQQQSKDQFDAQYGKLFDVFERRQRLQALLKARTGRLKVIALSFVATILSALAVFLPMGLAATPAAPAAVPLYGALSAVAAIPAAASAFIGARLAWSNYKLGNKVSSTRDKVDYAISPNVDEYTQTQKQRMGKTEPGYFRRAVNALGGLFSGLFGKKASSPEPGTMETPLLKEDKSTSNVAEQGPSEPKPQSQPTGTRHQPLQFQAPSTSKQDSATDTTPALNEPEQKQQKRELAAQAAEHRKNLKKR